MTDQHLPARPRRSRPRPVTTAPTRAGHPDTAPLASLVASARKIKGRSVARTSPQAWQDEAWSMYDEVGELRFVSNTLASAASRARLFAATVSPGADHPAPIRTNPDTIDPDDPPTDDDVVAAEHVAMLARNVLGRSEMLRRIVLHLFVPGDGYLVGVEPGVLDTRGPDPTPAPTEEISPEGGVPLERLEWHPLSVSEVSMRAGVVELNVGDAEPVKLSDDDCVVVRIWRPHPRRWWQADSPVRANLPVLRELVGLTKHVSASIDSRLAGAGLLVLPNSVEVVGGAVEAEVDDGEPTPGFVDALIDAMVTPLEDRDSAASLVPLVIRVPDDAVDKVKHLRFDTPLDEHAKDLRDEAIRRLALGLDAPPEVLLGLGDTNHWSAWQIDESTAKLHIEPLLGMICDALTTQYLWPTLEAAGVADPSRYVVWFDASDLTQRPNRTDEATAGHQLGLLSDEAWRRHAGFDESDAPETAAVDAAVELALELVARAPSLLANPGLPAIVDQIRTASDGRTGMPDSEVEVDSGRDLPDRADPPDAAAANGRQPVGAGR